MKKVFFLLMALVLAVGLTIPMAVPAMASPATVTVVSDTTVQIIGVYNKAGGGNVYVDLSGSPLSAVRAQEPDPYSSTYVAEPPEAIDSTWDEGLESWFEINSTADWIWETERAEGPASYAPADPLYDADASTNGRVVVFEQTFDISGTPIGGTLYIAADNCWEVLINGVFLARSSTAKVAGWETSNLYEASVGSTGWNTISIGPFAVPAVQLLNGENTITVLAGNEQYDNTSPYESNNSSQPVLRASPYRQLNPGAVIFQLEIEYEEGGVQEIPDIQLVKTGNETAHEGDIITYFYAGNNTGEIAFWGGNVTVIDSLGITVMPVLESDGNVTGDTDKNGWLDPGEEWLFSSEYVVPCFTLGPVENTGNITALFGDGEEVWAIDDWSVEILHNPDIEVTKTGPTGGYFTSLNAYYEYTVTNTGDACLGDVSLIDDMVGMPVLVDDGDGDEYLSPAETWYYEAEFLLECTGDTTTVFSNTATGNGTDVEGTVVEDFACWNVVVFQWLPRTIGYWGNWDNHWSADCMADLVAGVNGNSTYFEGLETANVQTILLASNPTGKMDVAKATALLKKQLLAAWLNVVSYMGATDGNETTCGSLDAAMDPNATVYLTESSCAGAVALFGETATVQEILDEIEANIGSWNKDQLLMAKCVLDWLNNGGHEGYGPFMDPEFDPAECAGGPVCVEAAIIYGTERDGNNLGDIYAIDLEHGTATFLYSPNLSPGSGDYPNGNAFDAVNNRLYYADPNTAPAKLYFYDFAGTQTLAGTITGVAASGEFYDGRYYYVPQNTNDLWQVTFDQPGGTIAAGGVSLVKSNFGTNKSYGDIAISSDGMLYGSPIGGPFYTIDLTAVGLPYATPAGADAIGLQLAFGSDGVLYGHSAGTGEFFTIDTATGMKTLLWVSVTGSNTGKFTDLANGPMICE